MSFPDIRKSRKWLSAAEFRLLVFALILLLALLAGNLTLARTLPGGEWFFLRWSGARAHFIEKVAPYSTEIAQRTQEVAYGRPAFSSEYGFVLNDPFYIVLLYTPLALLSDFAWARAIWMLFSEVALAGIMLFAFNLSEWQPPRWLYGLVFLFGLVSYFSLNALLTGTPTILLTFLALWILIALRSQSDELAGVLLALIAYQWEVSGPFFLFVLLFVFANRRWKVLAGFGMSLAVLLMVSFLAYPGWGLPYLRAVISDWHRGANLTFSHMLATWFPELGFPLGILVSAVFGLILFIEWLGALHSNFRRVVWTVSLSLAATPLIGLAIFPSNQAALLLPFVLILALAWERWRRLRVPISILVFLLALLIPFGLYLRSVYIYDPRVTDLISILPPIAAMIGLYWMRWWVLHSPRTWFDQAGDQA